MKCPYCIKVCSRCNRILVANSSNFNKQKAGKYGLRSNCKECRKTYRKEHNINLIRIPYYDIDNIETIIAMLM